MKKKMYIFTWNTKDRGSVAEVERADEISVLNFASLKRCNS